MLHLVFEGPDGSGKSTMAAMLAVELKRAGFVVHTLHQPGCNKVASRIRKVFKGQWGKPCKMAQFHLAIADHFEFIEELNKIKEIARQDLDHPHVVIQDRHSAVSGWAYQVCGSGVDPQLWRNVYSVPSLAPLHTPDYIFLYLPELATILKRIRKRGEKRDHFEQTEFLKKVIHGYFQVPHEGPFASTKYIISSAKGSIADEYKRVIMELAERFTADEVYENNPFRVTFNKLNVAYHMSHPLALPKIKVKPKK